MLDSGAAPARPFTVLPGGSALTHSSGSSGTTGDDDRLLWRQVTAGETVTARAPGAPDSGRLAVARAEAAAAVAAEERLAGHVDDLTAQLASPAAWFQPARRHALARQLRLDRGHLGVLRARAAKAISARDQLEDQLSRHRAYLDDHRPTLDTAKLAKAELDRRIDDVITAHAASTVQPPWFRYGLGFPPEAASYPAWLRRARAAVGYRLRFRVDHQLEPLGTEPPEHSKQRQHWLAAREA
ncbi:hypothetical protein [Longispora albida]|uniref:hypothetical protein n=1 Tax=Longispora albida TaxID=203523 RepID=UPI0003811509|nr:hypothetical protein [Longispora albida]